MGEPLGSSALQRIAYFYDTLKLPADLIEYLVGYCVQKGHKSMRYIEKIAASWAEAGITSVKQAKLETANHNMTISLRDECLWHPEAATPDSGNGSLSPNGRTRTALMPI